jgi:uncharacterized membrane protein
MTTTQKVALAGITGSACFAAALLLEQAGAASGLTEALFALGFAGFAAVIAALLLSRAGGTRFGQVALWIWLAGTVGLFVAGAVSAVTGSDDNVFFPIGGILTVVGGVLAAVPIARSGVLTAWRRWVPAALAAYYLFLMIANIAAGDDGWDSPVGMLGWPVLAIASGIAVLTEPATAGRATRAHAVPA